MNIRINSTGAKPASPTPEKPLPPAVTPEGANPATSGEDAAKVNESLPPSFAEELKKMDEVIDPVVVDKNAKVKYVKPDRGVRFRFARGEYVLGELDSLKHVTDWVIKNEVDPTKIEVLDVEGVWLNYDKVQK